MEIKISFGITEDCRKIREKVFVEEQGFKNEFDDIDQRSWHVVFLENKEPVATGRTFQSHTDQSTYTIGRIAVIKEWRGQGIGSMVVHELEKKAVEQGAEKSELSAQCRARAFYEKLGYEASGDVYMDEECPHIRMEKRIV